MSYKKSILINPEEPIALNALLAVFSTSDFNSSEISAGIFLVLVFFPLNSVLFLLFDKYFSSYVKNLLSLIISSMKLHS